MFDWLRKLFGMSDDPQILKGDGSFAFTAEVDGDDILVRGGQATWFGGANDPEDDGETASGVNTKKRPNILGCALPLNYGPCAGSPIPKVPWGTKVEITHLATGDKITVPVIDLGPARDTGHAIDLTVAVFQQFAPLATGRIVVDYRVLGAAKRTLS